MAAKPVPAGYARVRVPEGEQVVYAECGWDGGMTFVAPLAAVRHAVRVGMLELVELGEAEG